MKKIALYASFVLCAKFSFSQEDWKTDPMNIPTNINAKLGTLNDRSVSFVTNDSIRVTIDSLGRMTLPSFAVKDGKDVTTPDFRFLYIDREGHVTGTGNRVPSGISISCGAGTDPWLLGGNTLPADPVTGGLVGNSNLIGPCNAANFVLQANRKKSLVLTTTGNVGVGENNSYPSSILDVSDPSTAGNASGVREHLRIYGDGDGSIEGTYDMNLFYTNEFYIRQNTHANPGNWSSVFKIDQWGYTGIGTGLNTLGNAKLTVQTGNAYDNGALIEVNNDNNHSLILNNTSSGQSTFYVKGSGKTVIGHQSGSSNSGMANINVASTSGGPVNALDVYDQYNNKVNFRVKSNGDVYARYIKVTVNNIPDYVFEKNYQLLSLKEVESYYKKNKHLPEVPSAAEFEKEGMDVGEMNKLLLKKIEELTLYSVDQDKKVQELQNNMVELQKQIKALATKK